MKNIKILAFAVCMVFAFFFVSCSDGDNSFSTETKSSLEEKEVGDIVLKDGSAIPYKKGIKLTDEQKAAAVAVIFYKGKSTDILGAKTLGVGIHNTWGEKKHTLAWAKYDTIGQTTIFTDIQLDKEEDAPGEGTPYYKYVYDGTTYYITGKFDGSDNWARICAEDPNAAAKAVENYPAFNWVNNYAQKYNLSAQFEKNWYLPSAVELRIMFENKDMVNAALEAAGGAKIAKEPYWSSSQRASTLTFVYAWVTWFNDRGSIAYRDKSHKAAVCGIRAF